ncbi:MAG: acyl-CoA dehydrogenase family protein [Clostridiales bacterium]|nr:acyl-CoA dehydrogenase family protein [Clostridiales bacterium]
MVILREREAVTDFCRLETITRELQEKAKEEGLFLLHMPKKLGGLGLSFEDLAPILEEAGRSLLDPRALNAAAPDGENTNLLYRLATPQRGKRYPEPRLEGHIRSTFAMTEPMGPEPTPTFFKWWPVVRGNLCPLRPQAGFGRTSGQDCSMGPTPPRREVRPRDGWRSK